MTREISKKDLKRKRERLKNVDMKGMIEMNTYSLRKLFVEFLEDEGISGLIFDSCKTVDQASDLKYQKIDMYRVTSLSRSSIKKLRRFCVKHDIDVWLSADKLCIGYNYAGNTRL